MLKNAGMAFTKERPEVAAEKREKELYAKIGELQMDITYIKMVRGFMYLAAIIDVCSRKIFSWGLSSTMDVDWCVDIERDAFEREGNPGIFNTDQGNQFTSDKFVSCLLEERDGRNRI